MIFWLCVLIMVVGIVLWIIGSKEYIDWAWTSGLAFAIFFGITVIIMSLCLIANYSSVDAEIAENEERYEAITYKLESGACRDEFGLLSKEIIDEIQEWNEEVVYQQNMQDNFWVGIFYTDVFSRFKTIDYNTYQPR